MLQFIMETNTLFYAMAVLGILGAASQIFLGRVYTGLWKDAARGGQAQGKLMKRIRQRAGASPNPVLLVESSLMEYRTMGQSLHGWQRTGLFAAAGALLLGAAGWYLMRFQHLGRASVLAQQYLIFGAAAAAVVGVVHVLADIQYKKRNLETRMLDYLENICLHRYEKAYRKEKEESQKMKEKVVAASVDVSMSKNMAVNGESSVVGVDMSAGKNVATCTDMMTEKAGTAGTETFANKYAENENIVAANATVTPIRKELSKGDSPEENILREKEEKKEEKEEKKSVDKDVLIRQILEEFMA